MSLSTLYGSSSSESRRSDDVGVDVSSCKSHDIGDGDVISLLSPLAAVSLCLCRRSWTCQ